jgi:hypothetical protein
VSEWGDLLPIKIVTSAAISDETPSLDDTEEIKSDK